MRRLGPRCSLGLAAVLALGCAINPVSRRPELVLTTEAGEIEQGRKYSKVIEEQMGLVDDPALSGYVNAIGQRLVQHSPRRNLAYHFFVVEMAAPNAFALPGGYIYVSRGLLSMVNSEDELAGVIGHEIGHVAARHSVQRQARAVPFIPVVIATGIAGLATSIVSPSLGRGVAAIGQIPTAAVLATYSRGQEQESDRIGQQLSAESGWDPAALATFFQTLSREEALAGHDPDRFSFFASHPTSPKRADEGRAYAVTLTRAAPDPIAPGHAAFLERLDGVVVGESAAEGVFVGNRFLQPELDFALAFPKGWEVRNERQFVGARSPDEQFFTMLTIVAQGDDPLEAAHAVAEENGLREGPSELRIGGLAAAEGVSRTGGFMNRLLVHLTWIAHRGVVYQIAGVSPEGLYPDSVRAFEATARSFHPLSADERAEIRETRLRIARASEGETLAQLVERTGSAWTAEQVAVANALAVDAVLREGALIKIARPEPYAAP